MRVRSSGKKSRKKEPSCMGDCLCSKEERGLWQAGEAIPPKKYDQNLAKLDLHILFPC